MACMNRFLNEQSRIELSSFSLLLTEALNESRNPFFFGKNKQQTDFIGWFLFLIASALNFVWFSISSSSLIHFFRLPTV